uniref:ATPase AAA-type core domain-containing protein n=1 Tax=viral metagenome TaxID=1070528 RepID=A0A6C0JNK0_9ZZZZ
MPKISSDKKNIRSTNKNTKLKKNEPDSSDDESETWTDESSEDDSDSTYVPPKKNKKRSNKNSKSSRRRRIEDVDEDYDDDSEDYEDEDDEDEEEDDEDSDDYESDDCDDDEDDESEDEESEEEDDDENDDDEQMDKQELRKFISKIFPSKYMSKRIKDCEKEENKKSKKTSKKSDKKKKASTKEKTRPKRNKQKKRRDYDYSDEEDDEEEDYEMTEEDLAEEQKGFYSIVFEMDGEEDECSYNEEDDDAECDSEDEATFMKETYEKVDEVVIPQENMETETKKSSKKSRDKKQIKKDKNNKKSEEEEHDITDVEQEYLELVETKKSLITQLKKKPKSKILRNAVSECNRSIKKLVKKARTKNAKTYHKLIHDDKKRTNEIDYFKKKLSNKQQLRVMKDLKEINSFINIEKPYRLSLLDSKMPAKFKAAALQKLNVLRSMDPGDNEYYKIKNWVDTFMRIPFGVYKNLTVKMEDGIDVCHDFMENAKKTLDECVFGLNDAKIQIMQMLGQWIANPAAMGTAIAIKGQMGTGKTTLVKEGISKILGREFAFIALGGTGDASFLEGHSYTYEGSTWGKIVQILIESKCMNPVIYFDELDKISDTPRGEEIVGILTHLTDTSQNSQFHDKYFSEIDFDLSKCLFIFSYNDESKVNPILRDRMYRIQTKGYESKEKIIISKNYLLPKIQEQVNFKDEDIIIPNETLEYIISNTALTNEEAGVRNLKRCLEIIYTKLNLFRLVKSDSNIFGKDIELEVSFPFTVTKKVVDILIKNEEKQNQSLLAMYV